MVCAKSGLQYLHDSLPHKLQLPLTVTQETSVAQSDRLADPIIGLTLQGTVESTLLWFLQLLYPEDQNQKVKEMIQQYGQGLTGSDARLALEYYWQAAAVVSASQSVQVHLPLITLMLGMY